MLSIFIHAHDDTNSKNFSICNSSKPTLSSYTHDSNVNNIVPKVTCNIRMNLFSSERDRPNDNTSNTFIFIFE
jgi:hypothetical protein